MFKVIRTFADLQDGGHVYHEGDTFPRDGFEVSEERKKELLGSDNKIGKPLIEEEKMPTVDDKPVEEPKRKKSKDK